jgi:hypothetical protein
MVQLLRRPIASPETFLWDIVEKLIIIVIRYFWLMWTK